MLREGSLQSFAHPFFLFHPVASNGDQIWGLLVGEKGPCQATTTRINDLEAVLGGQKGPCQATTIWRKRESFWGTKGPCQAAATRRNKLGGVFEGTKRPLPCDDHQEKRMLLCRCFCVVFLFGGLGEGPSQATSRRRTFWEVILGKAKGPCQARTSRRTYFGVVWGDKEAPARQRLSGGHILDVWSHGSMGHVLYSQNVWLYMGPSPSPQTKEIPFFRVRNTRPA